MEEGWAAGGVMGVRGALRCSLLALCVLVAALALWSSPALALSQRGHVFGFSFGSSTSSGGELSNPAGVAVNESTGEVYVVNRGKKQVDRFACAALPCTLLSALAVPSPESVAVDNSGGPSTGDVYVSDTAGSKETPKGIVYKFNSAGTLIAKLAGVKEEKGSPLEPFGKIRGLAVGSTGVLWVDQGNEELVIDRFTGEAANKFIPPLLEVAGLIQGSPAPGFAVDSSENVYVGYEPSEAGGTCEQAPCVVAKFSTINEAHEEEAQSLIPELVAEDTTAVAVDLAGQGVFRDDAYLDTVTSIAELSPGGSLIQRFGAKELGFEGLKDGRGVAVDSKNGNVYVVDAATDTVDAFVLERAGPPTVDAASVAKVTSRSAELRAQIDPHGAETTYTFQYAIAAPVSCSGSPSCEVPIPPANIGAGFGAQPASAPLTNLQPGTVYHFRVLATNGNGSAVSEEQTFTTSGTIGELVLPDGRAWEMVSPPSKQGAGIEPIREEGGAIQAAANGDAIAYLADAPIVAQPEGSRNPEIAQALATRSSGGWSSQDISTPDETSLGPEAGQANEYRLFSPDLSLSLVFPFVGAREATGLAEPALSPPALPGEVQEKTAYLRADGPNPPLAPEATNEAIYSAASHNGEIMHNAGYLALVTAANDTAKTAFGQGKLKIANATPDLTHVVLVSQVPLTSSQPSAPAGSLYEWTAGQLQLISELPGGTLAPGGGLALGAEPGGHNSRHAISNDGSRVFWTAETGQRVEEEHLYMRDSRKEKTIQLDEVQGGSGAGFIHARYQDASADGSRVLFTDTQRLVAGSGAEGTAKADLYECEMTEAAGADKCVLSDLTPEHMGESAQVLGMVLGASEADASRVYFVANGVLTSEKNAQGEEATPGGCPPTFHAETPPLGATCNLYVSTRVASGAYKTAFIARLSDEDLPDWEAGESYLGHMTARVSPEGLYATFMSERSLTGYDNSDLNSNQPDEEVYLYNAETGHLVCASCNPSGQRPLGVLDTPNAGEGVGLLVDRPHTWSTESINDDPWLAGSIPGWEDMESRNIAIYQPRYLSDNGRLYFNSSDALVPQDTNRKEDVYEYEPEGILGAEGRADCTGSTATFSAKSSGCVSLISSGTSPKESAFLDASKNGSDVFFLTAASLLPQDVDTSFDVYDARECTGASPCLSPPTSPPVPCGGEESCKASSPSSPTFGAPASTTFSGAGNLGPTQAALPFTSVKRPLTRAQLLARALKTCKKQKRKSKRVACEKRAKKKYAAKSSKRKPSKKTSTAKKGSR